ncbi:MAG: tRNA epoxyqueuosine(34) reductase QueG [Methylobacteriaceae bacterium]|nr:tRNA epoxyqueuosine(34) reductase QueG [Methylobacteriaceae bacterium]
MPRRSVQRADPRALWPEVRSIVMLGANYGPDGDPLAAIASRSCGNISVYARHRDYHDVLKGRLKLVAAWLVQATRCEVKVFVDTAPVMEKPSAEAAGLGWQGKHTNLVSRQFGSWLFLGELLLSVELPFDQPEHDHCGQCHACLDICPTRAFPEPYRLDARRCISYLTIEHAGPVDEELRPMLGNRIYGCDDCLAVCPWNKFAQQARVSTFAPRPGLDAPVLTELAALDDAGFRRRFAGTTIKRIGRDRFMRNVCYALGNSGSSEARPAVQNLLNDDSSLVRDAARWALSRLEGRRP